MKLGMIVISQIILFPALGREYSEEAVAGEERAGDDECREDTDRARGGWLQVCKFLLLVV